MTITLALASDESAEPATSSPCAARSGLTLYFACEAVGIVASFVLWVATGLWPGATAERVVTWNLLLQRPMGADAFHRRDPALQHVRRK